MTRNCTPLGRVLERRGASPGNPRPDQDRSTIGSATHPTEFGWQPRRSRKNLNALDVARRDVVDTHATRHDSVDEELRRTIARATGEAKRDAAGVPSDQNGSGNHAQHFAEQTRITLLDLRARHEIANSLASSRLEALEHALLRRAIVDNDACETLRNDRELDLHFSRVVGRQIDRDDDGLERETTKREIQRAGRQMLFSAFGR